MSELRRHIMMQQGQSVPDYIQDGLIFWLDCLDFNGEQVWLDRIGNILFNNVGCTKQADGGVYFGNGNYMFSNNSPQTPSDTETTLEICMKINSISTSQSTPVFINCTSALFVINNISSVGCTRGDATKSESKVLGLPKYVKKTFSCFPYSNAPIYVNNILSNNTGGSFLFNILGAQGCFLGNLPTLTCANMDAAIYCIRVYNRQITAEERTYNFNIDKHRFGIV